MDHWVLREAGGQFRGKYQVNAVKNGFRLKAQASTDILLKFQNMFSVWQGKLLPAGEEDNLFPSESPASVCLRTNRYRVVVRVPRYKLFPKYLYRRRLL